MSEFDAVARIVDAFTTAYPTWYRGMYGCPDDMFSRQDVMRIIRGAQGPSAQDGERHPGGDA